MATEKTRIGPWAVIGNPKRDLDHIARARRVHKGLDEHKDIYPSPNPSLLVFGSHIDDYEKATADARNGGSTELATRKAKRVVVVADQHHLRDYVQGVIETIANPAQAAEAIVLAGFDVRRTGKHVRALFSADYGELSGSVVLDAKAAGVTALYYWELSSDQKTWISAPDTFQASTVISGLTPGQVYYFRFRVRTRAGMSDYSQIVSLLVH